MAIGWLAVLKNVPWTDVINNAPKVADGAKKLWKVIAKKSPSPEKATPTAQPGLAPEAQSIVTLEARLAAVEAAASDLHDQMLASSELIKALAEQNTQLIKRIEVNRVRVVRLTGVIVVIGIVAVANLTLTFIR